MWSTVNVNIGRLGLSRAMVGFGGRNVFRDLGLPNADEHLVKAQLVFKIDTLMKERCLKQIEAAVLFGIRQPDVSKMLRGDFGNFRSSGCRAF